MNAMNIPKGWFASRVSILVLGALLLTGGPAQGQADTIAERTCTVPDMVDDLRAALKNGSPALKRYVRELFKEASIGLPFEDLVRAFATERDPDVVEALGAAIAARSSRESNANLVRPIMDRIAQERDPQARAAAVRSLRGIGSVEAINKVDGTKYDQLVRDVAPEVRLAAAENLVHESDKVYFGHDKAVSEMAVSAASAASDPEIAAKLLGNVSMEQVDHETVELLEKQLSSDHEGVRASASRALGGVPGPEANFAREKLLQLYRRDENPHVRRAVLEALARLGLSDAVPTLESLRSVDPSMATEIDAWVAALGLHLQEWHLVLREKQRLAP